MMSMPSSDLPLDVTNVCRTCCQTAPPHGTVSVFRVHMSRKLMALTGVQVWPADGLPARICHDCIVKLDISFQFKKQCESADRRLRQHLAAMQAAKERSIEQTTDTNILLEAAHLSDLGECTLLPVKVTSSDLNSHNENMLADLSQNVPGSMKSDAELLGYTFDEIDPMDVKDNTKGFQCETCFKVFPTSTKLSRHVYVHTGQRPFKCEVCKRAFSHNSNLKAHMKLHTDERPFVCSVCKKGCRRAKDLELHMRTHTGEKPHVCKTCGRGFSCSSNLIAHFRTHTGEKPYVCSLCQKAFCQSNELSKHKKIHVKEKHVCEICNKAFSGSSALIVHVMNHNEERSNVCNICYKSFITPASLTAHLQKHAQGQLDF